MSKEAMKLARDLAHQIVCGDYDGNAQDVLEKLDEALAKQEHGEPVAWMFQHEDTGLTDCVDAQQVEWGFEKNNPRWQKIGPLYTTPQQRKPMTDEQIEPIAIDVLGYGALRKQDMELFTQSVRAIEAAHGIKE